MSCRRGEIYWIDWEPARGAEQRGRRPGLVVQTERGNQSSRATVVAAVSSAELPRSYPFMVALAPGEAGLPRGGHVNCAQLLTIDQARLLECTGTLSTERMRQVDKALCYELGLDP